MSDKRERVAKAIRQAERFCDERRRVPDEFYEALADAAIAAMEQPDEPEVPAVIDNCHDWQCNKCDAAIMQAWLTDPTHYNCGGNFEIIGDEPEVPVVSETEVNDGS